MVATAIERSRTTPEITAIYDRAVDVLYIVLGDEGSYEGDGLPRGIELDFDMKSGKPSGAKVIGFQRYGWFDDVTHLAGIIGNHLAVPPPRVEAAIAESLRRD